MNRYQLLKQNDKIIFKFIKNGILSYQIIRDIEIYENFQAMSDIKNFETRYILLGDEYELSAKRIEQIVLQMQKMSE
jgi:hypothetical protein